jgi:hypothetical protein
MNKIPDYMKNSGDGDYWQALADNYEAKIGESIKWTDRGPMVGSLNLSYMFMYPPIIDIQRFTDELKNETESIRKNN